MGTARNIAAAQIKKLKEYVKSREYLSGEASLRVRNISERRCIYGDERRMKMQELKKILEEIDIKIAGSMGKKREGLLEAQKIIRKH